ncbi:hypothetical protein [Gynuella sunshinyii]|uniref:Uncharacterized protein n=1 Tax=Gynuella sunshinyii YC6258 TaxID=1445510 RepID=A0A0C5VL92_9GAMM|nr:hypothetical protein [Gynuella sunshinyii]AJQ94123.1 hypothetical Protein YC6258_02081 [Gynuella sunshinyii YC6258]
MIGGGKFENGARTVAMVHLLSGETTEGAQKDKPFQLRPKDRHPDIETDTDLVARGVEQVVNSPDGKFFVKSDLEKDQGMWVTKEGSTLTVDENGMVTVTGLPFWAGGMKVYDKK